MKTTPSEVNPNNTQLDVAGSTVVSASKSPEPTSAPEKLLKPKKSKKPLIIAIIAVILAAGIAAVVTLAITQNWFGKKADPKTSQNQNADPNPASKPSNPATEEAEIEINDGVTKAYLDDIITSLIDCPKGICMVDGINFETGTLDDDSKLYYALSSQHKNVYSEELIVSADTVADAYKKMFGEELEHRTSATCPRYEYDAQNKVYRMSYNCGGSSDAYHAFYSYNYTIKDDKAYVYRAIGSYGLWGNGCNVYKDYINWWPNTSLDQELYYSSCPGSGMDFKITDSNYNDFAHYRYVFTKAADGTYYFEKIEKL